MNPAWGIAAGTLLSEDGALAVAAGAWASGRWSFESAFLGAWLGITVGDWGLYALGRALGPVLERYAWFRSGRWQAVAKRWGVGSPAFVALARLLPGARLPGYTAAGILRKPWWPFALTVAVSAFAWVGFWFAVARPLGQQLNGLALILALLAALLLMTWIVRGFQDHEWRLRWIDLQRLRWPEFWPAWLFYTPVALNYAWLSLRYRDALLPTLCDPGIEHGGFINESKDAIFRLIPAGHPALLAWQLHEPGSRPQAAVFPLIAKPDAGQRGSGVRLLRDQAALDAYAADADYRFLTQEYCDYAREAGVFYVRQPGEAQGRLFSLTEKRFPYVTGDGQRDLAQLILDAPRDRYMARVLFERHAERLHEVLPAGERLRLVESGNHCQGTVFLDGRRLAGEGLRREIDAIAQAMPGFYIGRFDLRYQDEAGFAEGRDFKIIEVNGATSEATHIYDPALPLREVYATLFEQWRLVFAIGDENRRRGLKSSKAGDLLRALFAYRRSSRRHPVAS